MEIRSRPPKDQFCVDEETLTYFNLFVNDLRQIVCSSLCSMVSGHIIDGYGTTTEPTNPRRIDTAKD